MSDERLRAVEREYRADPNEEAAQALTMLILRSGMVEPCTTSNIDRVQPGCHYVYSHDSVICFSRAGLAGGHRAQELKPVAFHLLGEKSRYYILPRDERSSTNNRHINAWLGRHGYTVGEEIPEIRLNWELAVKFDCRLYSLLQCYKQEQHPAIAGMVADTYLQSKDEPHGTPLRIFEGIDNYPGRRGSAGRVSIVSMGTYSVLVSYLSPSAAINNITNQCFYTDSRSQTTATHIGKWFRSRNMETTKWQKDCIELPQCVFNALFSL